MPGWLLRWVLNVLCIVLTAYVVKGFEVTLLGALFGSIILGMANAVIRPIILVLTLPINVLTLGLFTLMVNGLILWMTSGVVKGFDVYGFGTAVIAALVLSVFSLGISLLVKD